MPYVTLSTVRSTLSKTKNAQKIEVRQKKFSRTLKKIFLYAKKISVRQNKFFLYAKKKFFVRQKLFRKP